MCLNNNKKRSIHNISYSMSRDFHNCNFLLHKYCFSSKFRKKSHQIEIEDLIELHLISFGIVIIVVAF